MNQEIYNKIQAECDRQDEKWGIRNNHPLEWLTILYEETGEVAMEVNDAGHDVANLDIDKYETELVQCGAVITQMLKNIEQYKIFKTSVLEDRAMEAMGVQEHIEKTTDPELEKIEDEFEKLPVNNNFTIIPKVTYMLNGKGAGDRNTYIKAYIIEITDHTILYRNMDTSEDLVGSLTYNNIVTRMAIDVFNTKYKVIEQL